jgi:hypothetical protein
MSTFFNIVHISITRMLIALGVYINMYQRPSLPRIRPWVVSALTTRLNPRPVGREVVLHVNV